MSSFIGRRVRVTLTGMLFAPNLDGVITRFNVKSKSVDVDFHGSWGVVTAKDVPLEEVAFIPEYKIGDALCYNADGRVYESIVTKVWPIKSGLSEITYTVGIIGEENVFAVVTEPFLSRPAPKTTGSCSGAAPSYQSVARKTAQYAAGYSPEELKQSESRAARSESKQESQDSWNAVASSDFTPMPDGTFQGTVVTSGGPYIAVEVYKAKCKEAEELKKQNLDIIKRVISDHKFSVAMLDAIREERDGLAKEIKDVRAREEKTYKRNAELLVEVDRLKSKANDLTAANVSLVKEKNTITSTLNAVVDERDKLKVWTADTNKLNAEWQEKYDLRSDDLKIVMGQRDKYKNELNSARAERDIALKENAALKAEIAAVVDNASRLDRQSQESHSKLWNDFKAVCHERLILTAEAASLREQIDKYKKIEADHIEKLVKCRENNESHMKTIKQLQREVEVQKANGEHGWKGYHARVQEANNQEKHLREQINKLVSETGKLQGEKNALKHQVDACLKAVEALTKEKEALVKEKEVPAKEGEAPAKDTYPKWFDRRGDDDRSNRRLLLQKLSSPDVSTMFFSNGDKYRVNTVGSQEVFVDKARQITFEEAVSIAAEAGVDLRMEGFGCG